jgi:RimJ/RimL family protein N-acetyltransferase
MAVILHAAARGPRPALCLRPWSERDIPDLIRIYRDPDMRRQAGTQIVTDDDARRWLEIQQKGWRDGDRLSFAVLESAGSEENHQLRGNVVLKGHSAGKASAEAGYWTAPGERGRGIASGALETLTTWAFEVLDPGGLQYIELLHQVGNQASCRVAQKCGYALAGILAAQPPAFPADGHLHRRYSPRCLRQANGRRVAKDPPSVKT